MDEDVGGAIIGGDKTVALVRVEPFHGSLSHLAVSFEGRAGNPRTFARISCWPLATGGKSTSKAKRPLSKPRASSTIADFDNNSNLKHIHGQSIPPVGATSPYPQPCLGGPAPPAGALQTRSEQAGVH